MCARYSVLLVVAVLAGCATEIKDMSYQANKSADKASFFVYTPDTQLKTAPAVVLYMDQMKIGELAENRPLQFSANAGWHSLVVHRLSVLGAREELARFDILVEKDQLYYVRYAKNSPATVSIGTPIFGVVDESIGRQMQ